MLGWGLNLLSFRCRAFQKSGCAHFRLECAVRVSSHGFNTSSVIKVRCGTHYFPESDVVDAAGPVAVMRAVLVYSTYVFLI